jgi:FkbM family methyltransferase
MIIDRQYITCRLTQLIADNDFAPPPARTRRISPYRIKMAVPKWLRAALFHPWNPLYLLWGKTGLWKACAPGAITYNRRHPMAVDFITYCFTHDIRLDTHDFFDRQDEEIADCIDKKIKTFLTGCKPDIPQHDAAAERAFVDSIKYRRGFYELTHAGRNYYLPYNLFSFELFNRSYGLDRLPQGALDALPGKDFIDVGAFYGDSAIMFLPYSPRKIYAYEPVPASYNVLLKTIRRNAPEVIVPVKKGLGDAPQRLHIGLNASASSLLPAFRARAKTTDIEINTLDNECRDRRVGLIKMDVEGFEYHVIRGGLETIRRDRPVLLISIYHTGRDFFEIPPMIRACCRDYKFLFTDLAPTEPIAEKMLIAYCA